MKISHIILSESVRRNNKRMNESFVIPYNNYLKTIAPSIKKINEAELTVDQINQIFSAAEQGATAAGDNRTLLGKGKDKAQDIINKILPAQKKAEFEQNLPPADAGPVQGFEQQAQQAIDQVEDPKAKKSLMDLVKQGIKNPVTQTLLMTAITGIAGVVAAPAIASLGLTGIAASTAIGAVVGGLTGVVKAKMGGADWKEAGKQGLKGAGMGAAAGAIGGTVATLGQQAIQAYQQHQQQQNTAGEDPMKADNDMYGPGGSAEEKVLPVQARSVDDNVAQQWAQASPAERAKIEQTTGLTPQQIQSKLNMNAAYSNADLAAIRASGNSSNPDGTASPAMARYMQAQADAMAADTKYQQATGMASTGAEAPANPANVLNNPEAPINPNAAQQQTDLNNAIQNRIDTGAIPAPTTGFTEVTPQGGDITGQLKNLVSQGYTVQRSQTDPSAISITDQSGNLMQQFKPPGGAFNASRMSAAANGINLRESIIDKRSTIQHWALNESLGRPRGNVQLTPFGVRLISEGVMDWIKTKGHNLTTKVTADKLMQAWKKAGSPTDSAVVSKVLADAGVSQDVVSNVYSQLKIPMGPSTTDAEGGKVEPTMDNPDAQTSQDPAVWKNNRNPNAPAGTSPADAAAKAGVGQPAPETPVDKSKEETPPATTPAVTGQQPAQTTATGQQPAQTGQQPAQTTATGQKPAPAGADKFIQQLIDGFNALTPEEKAEIQKELQIAMDASENQNIVKGVNEALRKQFAKLTLENIEWWVNSKAGRSSNKRIYEAALLEISYRKAKLKKRYQ